MNKIISQAFRFGLVGVTAAGIHVSTVILLVQLTGMAPLVANIFGFSFAFQMSYFGNRHWTFHESTVMHKEAYLKLISLQVVNFILNEGLFNFFLNMHLPYVMALIIVLAILPIFTFSMSKLWVFAS